MTTHVRKNAWRHGTVTGYSNRGCRCEPCKEACSKNRTARRSRAEETVHAHGYGGYTNGCRCETCKSGKRDYMAVRREQGTRLADQRAASGALRAADHLKHGTQSAYYEHGCRCPDCVEWGKAWRTSSGRPRA